MSSAARSDLLSSQVRRRIIEFIADRPGELAAAHIAQMLDLPPRHHNPVPPRPARGGRPAHRQTGTAADCRPPRKIYSVADSTHVNEAAYIVLVEVLAGTLPSGPERPRLAGEAWAARHVSDRDLQERAADPARLPVKEVIDVLARWGYGRETVSVEPGLPGCHRLTLTVCPVREVAAAYPKVVCAAHQGLIQGTLDRLGVPGAEVDVRPWSPRTPASST